jgi:hypothetical protein
MVALVIVLEILNIDNHWFALTDDGLRWRPRLAHAANASKTCGRGPADSDSLCSPVFFSFRVNKLLAHKFDVKPASASGAESEKLHSGS